MLKKCEKDDHDSKVRYINTITSLTHKIIDVIKLNDNYEEQHAWFSALKLDKTNEYKKAVRAMEQETQENEKHDELISKPKRRGRL